MSLEPSQTQPDLCICILIAGTGNSEPAPEIEEKSALNQTSTTYRAGSDQT